MAILTCVLIKRLIMFLRYQDNRALQIYAKGYKCEQSTLFSASKTSMVSLSILISSACISVAFFHVFRPVMPKGSASLYCALFGSLPAASHTGMREDVGVKYFKFEIAFKKKFHPLVLVTATTSAGLQSHDLPRLG